VAPPSGRFIVQLFLVPGLIVAVAVLVLLGFRFLVGGTPSPEELLKKLDDPNPDVRWRGASDLAQVLKRPESLSLASDPRFGLDLAERLQTALDDLRKEEEDLVKRTARLAKPEREAARNTLAARRNYVLYLGACLGNLTIPVGVSQLCAAARDDRGSDRKAVALRRRRAVWALANLGDNLQRFRELSARERRAVLARLAEEAAGPGQRARWAKQALDYLKDNKPLGVDQVLAECAEDREDLFLREMVAFALRYWDGDEVEPTLVKLAHDPGEGTFIEVDEGE
jgi:hypothetical protein